MDAVFKMYRKSDPLSPEGSGIGLTICKKIIDRHHGSLTIESDQDFVHFKFTWGEQ
jgi:signal transduction histidine kinase